MKKANSYNWILRIVDNNGEHYELKLDYTLSNMRIKLSGNVANPVNAAIGIL